MNGFDRQLRSLIRRARLGVARGILRLIDDSAGLQTAQVGLMANEVRSKVERVQEYGFTSHPLPGAEATVVFVGGNRDHGLIIAVDDRRYRLKALEAGEVAIYTDEGDSIVLKRENNIEITTRVFTVNASERIDLNAPETNMGGNCSAQGEVQDHSGTMQEMRDIYNTHTHPEDASGNTEEPNQEMD